MEEAMSLDSGNYTMRGGFLETLSQKIQPDSLTMGKLSNSNNYLVSTLLHSNENKQNISPVNAKEQNAEEDLTNEVQDEEKVGQEDSGIPTSIDHGLTSSTDEVSDCEAGDDINQYNTEKSETLHIEPTFSGNEDDDYLETSSPSPQLIGLDLTTNSTGSLNATPVTPMSTSRKRSFSSSCSHTTSGQRQKRKQMAPNQLPFDKSSTNLTFDGKDGIDENIFGHDRFKSDFGDKVSRNNKLTPVNTENKNMLSPDNLDILRARQNHFQSILMQHSNSNGTSYQFSKAGDTNLENNNNINPLKLPVEPSIFKSDQQDLSPLLNESEISEMSDRLKRHLTKIMENTVQQTIQRIKETIKESLVNQERMRQTQLAEELTFLHQLQLQHEQHQQQKSVVALQHQQKYSSSTPRHPFNFQSFPNGPPPSPFFPFPAVHTHPFNSAVTSRSGPPPPPPHFMTPSPRSTGINGGANDSAHNRHPTTGLFMPPSSKSNASFPPPPPFCFPQAGPPFHPTHSLSPFQNIFQHHQNQLNNNNNNKRSDITDMTQQIDATNSLCPSLYGNQVVNCGTGTRRKRTKVTDTRLSPRNNVTTVTPTSLHCPHSPDEQLSSFSTAPILDIENTDNQNETVFPQGTDRGPLIFGSGTTGLSGGSVGRTSSPTPSGSIDRDCLSRDNLMDGFEANDGLPQTVTLTPVHLRKAKLMFFYTRYPSSSLIKAYFHDVKFNKNNTAQLVKWFSNFREFYYIQMEKYARAAIAEGVQDAECIHVSTESELYRVINLHYNRNNQIEVPSHFRVVVESTLREFFKAISTQKDLEQSWKKPIYKVIARMDQSVPEFFKSSNWMDQLSDN